MVENLSEEPLLPQRKQAVRALLECKDPKEPDTRGDIRHRANAINEVAINAVAINAVANLSRLIQGCRPQKRRSVARSKKHLTKPSPEPPAKSSKIYTFDLEHHCAFCFGDQRIAYKSVHRFVRLKDIRKHISKKHADLHADALYCPLPGCCQRVLTPMALFNHLGRIHQAQVPSGMNPCVRQ